LVELQHVEASFEHHRVALETLPLGWLAGSERLDLGGWLSVSVERPKLCMSDPNSFASRTAIEANTSALVLLQGHAGAGSTDQCVLAMRHRSSIASHKPSHFNKTITA